MSVGDIKKIFNVYGTLLFGDCHIGNDYGNYTDVIPEKEKTYVIRKPIYSHK